MKQPILLTLLLMFGFARAGMQAQESTNEGSGDQFSLITALELFKNSSSLAEFEEAINNSNTTLHNLDINIDDEIDYLTVNDYHEDDVHVISISAIVGEDDFQDIAVIEIEKNGYKSATIQIVGDEQFFGDVVVIEPYDVDISSSGKGPAFEEEIRKIVMNVWLWPSVRYIYSPDYVTYRSPWRWSFYPRAWKPWKTIRRATFLSLRRPYASRYRKVSVTRVSRARVIYKPHRRSSKVVVKKRSTIVKANSTKKIKATRKTKVKNNRNSSKTKVKSMTKRKKS